MECNVNHPKHYNSNKSGVECIEIIRWYCLDIGNAYKYLWRCGLKEDASLTLREKEDEDINKAIWYIDDRIKQVTIIAGIGGAYNPYEEMSQCNSKYESKIYHPSGHEVLEFAIYYEKDIKNAMIELWACGLLTHHTDYRIEIEHLLNAKKYLRNYLNRPYNGCKKEDKKEILFS